MKRKTKKWLLITAGGVTLVLAWLVWYVPDSRYLSALPEGGKVLRKEIYRGRQNVELAQVVWYDADYESLEPEMRKRFTHLGFRAAKAVPNFHGTDYYKQAEEAIVLVLPGGYDPSVSAEGVALSGRLPAAKGTTVILYEEPGESYKNVAQCVLRGRL